MCRMCRRTSGLGWVSLQGVVCDAPASAATMEQPRLVALLVVPDARHDSKDPRPLVLASICRREALYEGVLYCSLYDDARARDDSRARRRRERYGTCDTYVASFHEKLPRHMRHDAVTWGTGHIGTSRALATRTLYCDNTTQQSSTLNTNKHVRTMVPYDTTFDIAESQQSKSLIRAGEGTSTPPPHTDRHYRHNFPQC